MKKLLAALAVAFAGMANAEQIYPFDLLSSDTGAVVAHGQLVHRDDGSSIIEPFFIYSPMILVDATYPPDGGLPSFGYNAFESIFESYGYVDETLSVNGDTWDYTARSWPFGSTPEANVDIHWTGTVVIYGPVPEPEIYASLLVGLGAIQLRRRRGRLDVR